MWGHVEGYERFMGRYSNRLAHEFVRAAGVAAGERVLDVGCGPGALTSALGGIVGAANVSGVDPTDAFVERSRRRVPGADLRVAAAEALPFEDGSFDRSLAQLVFHFVDDPAASVAEMARVTRSGGVVAACVWDGLDGMTMIRTFWDAAGEVDPAAPGPGERFGGRAGQLAGLWRKVGLRDVVDGELAVSAGYSGFDEFWESMSVAPGPVGVRLASLDEPGRDALAGALRRRLGSPEGPFRLAARAWYATGIV
jgi:SAM-dependent methyltransferase